MSRQVNAYIKTQVSLIQPQFAGTIQQKKIDQNYPQWALIENFGWFFEDGSGSYFFDANSTLIPSGNDLLVIWSDNPTVLNQNLRDHLIRMSNKFPVNLIAPYDGSVPYPEPWVKEIYNEEGSLIADLAVQLATPNDPNSGMYWHWEMNPITVDDAINIQIVLY
jgi:hypothetical protein